MTTIQKPLVQAARGEKPSRNPVWFMRQAGRYLAEYREVRAKVSFVEMCQTPALAAEVTLQPLRRYDLDAAIIFSDILIPCAAMGQDFTLAKDEGPQLAPPVRTAEDVKRLKRPNAEKDLGYVGDAITLTKKSMRPEQTMIGFAGAPFTVASYMVEGASSKNFTEVKRLLFREPETFVALLDHIADVTIDYLKMQVKAGADALMLFDTWAGNLTGADYRAYAFPSVAKVLREIRKSGVPAIYYPGQGLDKMFELQGLEVDMISVDWRTRLGHAAKTLKSVGLDVSMQGNLDPQQLIADEKTVRARARQLVEDVKGAGMRGHVYNVGHGLLPHIPPESLHWVIDEVHRG